MEGKVDSAGRKMKAALSSDCMRRVDACLELNPFGRANEQL